MLNKNKTLLGFLVALGLFALSPPQEAMAATMYVWPASQHFADGATNTIYVGIDTAGASSNAADMYLSFNPAEIEIISTLAGNAYEGYLAPQTVGNTVRLSAYSIGRNLTGKATFATVRFKNKPGVEKASIGFVYSPGASNDSNVADLSSKDILTGVGRGNYTFGKVEKAAAPEKPADVTPPVVTELYPSPNTEGVPANSVIHFYVGDEDSGVLLKTVRVTVNDTAYTLDNQGELRFISYGNNNKKYSVTVIPREPFTEGVPVKVKIEARDTDGNWLKPVEIVFNEEGTLHLAAPRLEGIICDSFVTCSHAWNKLKLVEKVLLGKGLNYNASTLKPDKKSEEDNTLHAAAGRDLPFDDMNKWLGWGLILLILLAIMSFSYRKMRQRRQDISQWKQS